ncbi:MAG TPA: hypothetical protein VF988_08080 [Verrucomicrobiae bacterium]
MNNPVLAAAKLKMMRESVKCLIYGLMALLPVLGAPFGLAALWFAGRARVQERRFWNAAKPYRIIGTVCAVVGLIGWFLLIATIAFHNVSQPASHGGYYGDE